MKLSRSQTLVISPVQLPPPTPQTNPNLEAFEPNNLSSSSSSSLTSSSNINATLTPTHKPANQQPVMFYQNPTTSSTNLTRMNSSSLINKYQRHQSNSSQTTLSHQQHQHQQQQQQQMALFNAGSPSLNLICNRCGKTLNEKASTSISSTNDKSTLNMSSSNQVSTFNLSSSLNQYLPIVSSNNSGNLLSTSSELNLMGCLNCSNFLPQCTVCLCLMKINLVPLQSQNQNPIVLPKSQSVFFQSPKVMLPGNFAKKISIQFKSPNHNQPPTVSENSSTQTTTTAPANANKTNLTSEDLNSFEQAKEESKKLETNVNVSGDSLGFIMNTKIGNWFSWCQSCKHGGHIKHLIEWFRTNQKCPYLHCKCQCINIDYVY
jgi:hypothetical protein